MSSFSDGLIRVFISYSHKDEELKKSLRAHLRNLERSRKLSIWEDREIEAGAEWDKEISERIKAAQIILLLISADFQASPYCYEKEVAEAINRHDSGQAIVVPIHLRPCYYKGAKFSKLQALPKDAKPITKWDNRDEAFKNVVEGIDKLLEQQIKRENESKFIALCKYHLEKRFPAPPETENLILNSAADFSISNGRAIELLTLEKDKVKQKSREKHREFQNKCEILFEEDYSKALENKDDLRKLYVEMKLQSVAAESIIKEVTKKARVKYEKRYREFESKCNDYFDGKYPRSARENESFVYDAYKLPLPKRTVNNIFSSVETSKRQDYEQKCAEFKVECKEQFAQSCPRFEEAKPYLRSKARSMKIEQARANSIIELTKDQKEKEYGELVERKKQEELRKKQKELRKKLFTWGVIVVSIVVLVLAMHQALRKSKARIASISKDSNRREKSKEADGQLDASSSSFLRIEPVLGVRLLKANESFYTLINSKLIAINRQYVTAEEATEKVLNYYERKSMIFSSSHDIETARKLVDGILLENINETLSNMSDRDYIVFESPVVERRGCFYISDNLEKLEIHLLINQPYTEYINGRAQPKSLDESLLEAHSLQYIDGSWKITNKANLKSESALSSFRSDFWGEKASDVEKSCRE